MIKTDRNQFVGVHVTKTVKRALVEESKRRKVSRSQFAAEAIEEKLKGCGCDLSTSEPVSGEEELPLPL